MDRQCDGRDLSGSDETDRKLYPDLDSGRADDAGTMTRDELSSLVHMRLAAATSMVLIAERTHSHHIDVDSESGQRLQSDAG
jgi:hypothetical protein